MSNEIQFILYHLPNEEGKVQVVIKDETIWATQKAMAQLFGVGIPAISKHLTHIFDEGELDKEVVVSKMEITTQHGAIEGKTQKNEATFYSLDAIIAVGYRVSSARATKFRIWATKILNEYIRKGFVLDDERLKQGKAVFGKDYFRELLERVRSIRASERRIWQQITDIYAECSFDYDRNSPTTREFYQMVQNRFHYAITGQTAPEIIYTRADHNKEHMGLQTWKNAPDGRVLLSDTKVAKNYLPEKEIRQLEQACNPILRLGLLASACVSLLHFSWSAHNAPQSMPPLLSECAIRWQGAFLLQQLGLSLFRVLPGVCRTSPEGRSFCISWQPKRTDT